MQIVIYNKKYLYSLFNIKGLYINGNNPFFYDFDTRMTKNILFGIISEIHKVGFEVVGIVSDMGPTNIGLWKELGIQPSSSAFINPVIHKSYPDVFADVTHLLKLARNHFIDKGFLLASNVHIGREIIEDYLKATTSSDFKLAYKLSERHLNVSGKLRQNVKLAAQLFSNRLAHALIYCGENKIITHTNWKEVSIIIIYWLLQSWIIVSVSNVNFIPQKQHTSHELR